MKFKFPLRVNSTLNKRQHYLAKWSVSKKHRQAAMLYTANALFGKNIHEGAPLTIWITRYGKKELDFDNLAGALKSVRDGIADALGLKSDKESPTLSWKYGQAKGEYMIEVEIMEEL